jgi:hypothetical protein
MTTTPAVPVPIEATVIAPAADSLGALQFRSPQENRERGRFRTGGRLRALRRETPLEKLTVRLAMSPKTRAS